MVGLLAPDCQCPFTGIYICLFVHCIVPFCQVVWQTEAGGCSGATRPLRCTLRHHSRCQSQRPHPGTPFPSSPRALRRGGRAGKMAAPVSPLVTARCLPAHGGARRLPQRARGGARSCRKEALQSGSSRPAVPATDARKALRSRRTPVPSPPRPIPAVSAAGPTRAP